MKKILAFVLAIAMVLGMATVGFAADTPGVIAAGSNIYLVDSATYKTATLAAGDIVILTQPTVKVEFVANNAAYKATALDTIIGYAKVTTTPGTFYVVGVADGATAADKVQQAFETTQYYAPETHDVTITDNMQNTGYTVSPPVGDIYTITAPALTAAQAPTEYYVADLITAGYATVFAPAAGTVDAALWSTQNPVVTGKYTAPVMTEVDWEVFNSLYVAYNQHSDNVDINLNETSIGLKTITVADWSWMLNTYAGLTRDLSSTYIVLTRNASTGVATTWASGYNATTDTFTSTADASQAASLKTMGIGNWWPTTNWQYLSMNFRLTDGTTIYYISSADIDYTWNKAVDFRMDDGLSGYIKSGSTTYTTAEMYNFIRALTGDTKNPYTFGWTCATAGAEVAVPTMTVSYVIPQQWINVYGHKNLALWVYSNTEKCEVCGQTHQMGHVLTTTTLDATTQTQRIEFTTSSFYRTLVLSQTAVTATEPTDDNPNTGANDIVNVAIVFAVISLVAAGAFVFSKQR